MEIVQTLRSVSVFVMEDSMCMTRCNTTLIRVFSTSLKIRAQRYIYYNPHSKYLPIISAIFQCRKSYCHWQIKKHLCMTNKRISIHRAMSGISPKEMLIN